MGGLRDRLPVVYPEWVTKCNRGGCTGQDIEVSHPLAIVGLVIGGDSCNQWTALLKGPLSAATGLPVVDPLARGELTVWQMPRIEQRELVRREMEHQLQHWRGVKAVPRPPRNAATRATGYAELAEGVLRSG